MTDRTLRATAFGLLASTALAGPAWAQTPPPADPANSASQQQATNQPDQNEIVITATKREENLQNVPIAVTVLGTKKLDQLNISNFEEYTKQLPSVTFQTAQPGFTTVYMRGVATGGDGNHSGSLPSVGMYLDEQPVTTIGGTLDVHIYDIARIESLAGPQGTLYGASSEAGTIRIITNKPELGITTGRIDGEINTVAHGDMGGKLEGMINLPIGNHVAFRASAFYERDGGYIDNVFGERDYTSETSNSIHFDNSCCLENNYNDLETYGGRAALKVDLNDNWTVTPTFLYQKATADGSFFMDADQRDLDTVRFQPEVAKDKFWQAALTVQGKLSIFDVTYAGAFMDRKRFATTDYTDYTDAYDAYYSSVGGILDYFYYKDNAGNNVNPRQHIIGTDHFTKQSHELRIASPADQPVRALVGAFYQKQTNHIFQNYLVDNLADDLAIPGYPDTLWLTNEQRTDKDWALFGEASWDILHNLTLTGGLRFYRFNNSLFGFAGFAKNPNFDEDQPPGGPAPNPAFGSSGMRRCFTVNGLQLIDDEDSPLATGDLGYNIPCFNVASVNSAGEAVPARSKGSGHIHRLNITWKPMERVMFYGTWSKGFRPGGINRQPLAPPYAPDFLTNYEFGWKTTFAGGRLRWNGAIYHQDWNGIQYSFLGPNSLTVIQNGRKARVNGIETDLNYSNGGLSLTASAAYTDAKTKGNICHAAISIDPSSDCSALLEPDDPDTPENDPVFDRIDVPSGTRLPITPKFKATVTGRYTWPMWTGRAHVQGVVAYQGSAPSDLNPGQNDLIGKIKSSTLVDLFLGYDWGKFNVELFGSNIFDERNELSRFVVCSICTQVKIVPGRPRTFGLRAGMKF
jgi:outer membrane receptor protein involved in Fe transport